MRCTRDDAPGRPRGPQGCRARQRPLRQDAGWRRSRDNSTRMARAGSDMDMNGKIAALLRDFAAIQTSKQRMWGYKRAAAAILALEEPIESLLQADGTLRKIPNIGPSSTRVILEVLQP